MDYKFLLQRFTQILFSPAKAWKSIHSGDKPLREVMISYLLPFLILLAVTSFTGSMFIANKEMSFVYSLLAALKSMILIFVVTWLSSLVLRETTYALDLGRDYQVAYRLIVYSLTPLYICLAISGLFESLVFVNILALYSLFIFWDGMIIMLDPPDHKKRFLLIATTISIAAILIVAALILNLGFERFYNVFFS